MNPVHPRCLNKSKMNKPQKPISSMTASQGSY